MVILYFFCMWLRSAPNFFFDSILCYLKFIFFLHIPSPPVEIILLPKIACPLKIFTNSVKFFRTLCIFCTWPSKIFKNLIYFSKLRVYIYVCVQIDPLKNNFITVKIFWPGPDCIVYLKFGYTGPICSRCIDRRPDQALYGPAHGPIAS